MAEEPKPTYVVTTQEERDAAMAAAIAYDQAQADAKAAERAAFLAELKVVTTDPRYTWLLGELERLAPVYKLDSELSLHIVPLPGFLSRLRSAVG
ncbi:MULTISPECIES: hypothetical protein [Sphingomonas]|uniref:Uncharacterized protein n=1 Tax=Sphingomonas molluscorum TaxID=418184 RepID=A0ABU8Q7P1_9SPHN|nr:hypothetical protein [Sphingomonas sp. JUb134]MBM7407048.1 hypothetical protein [Sphingomonas sp. JUb134]